MPARLIWVDGSTEMRRGNDALANDNDFIFLLGTVLFMDTNKYDYDCCIVYRCWPVMTRDAYKKQVLGLLCGFLLSHYVCPLHHRALGCWLHHGCCIFVVPYIYDSIIILVNAFLPWPASSYMRDSKYLICKIIPIQNTPYIIALY
jgi:hypothetical protein